MFGWGRSYNFEHCTIHFNPRWAAAAPRGSILAKKPFLGGWWKIKETKVHKFARIRKRRAKDEDTRRIRIILWLFFLLFTFGAAFVLVSGFLSFRNWMVGYMVLELAFLGFWFFGREP